ncbi:MAG: hypothetical protein KAH04_00615, partial [Psychrilyobacter sp.]|nr:hypothetical protein [Psychrilyobacter sp.]
NFNKNWNKTSEGWDTKFGLDYQGGNFDMMGKEWTFNPSVTFEYGTAENFTSKASKPNARDSEVERLLKFNPTISTTYYGFATDITPIIAYDDMEGTVAFQLNIVNYRKLNENWSTNGEIYIDFAGTKNDKIKKGTDSYNNGLFEGNVDGDNKFAFSIEEYLTYEKNVTGNLYFATEFALEAYSILQSTKNDVALYVEPKLFYKIDLGGSTLTPYVSYTAYSATGGYKDSYDRDELSIGVKFGTKF